MSSYPLAALQLKQSPFDPVGALQTAVQLGNAQANNEMARLRMAELQAESAENQDRRGSLSAFRQAGGMNNPAALTHLAGHPDVFTPVQTAMTAQQTIAREANARAAQRVASLPEGSRERTEAWQEELERARSEGRMSPEAYQRYAAYQHPPQLLLQGIIQQGRALPTAAELQRQRVYDELFGPDQSAVPSTAPTGPAANTPPPGAPRVTVNSENAGQFEGLMRDLQRSGVAIDPSQTGGYNPRNIAGTNTPSMHASGRAVDVNWNANPVGPLPPTARGGAPFDPNNLVDAAGDRPGQTQIPTEVARALARKNGLRWGGDFQGRSPDPMHFEVAAAPPVAGRALTTIAGAQPPAAAPAGRFANSSVTPETAAPPAATPTAPPAANMSLRDRVRSLTREQQDQVRLLMAENKTEDALKLIREYSGDTRPPEAIRTQGIKADQAYTNLTAAIDAYQNLIKTTGVEAFQGQNMELLTQQRRAIQLQLKELFNLGVLNGPDLDLMDSMIFDPTVGIRGIGPGGVVPVPYGLANIMSGFGITDVDARAAASLDQLRETLRGIRNSQTQIIGLPAAGLPLPSAVPPAATAALRANPNMAADFDKKYGTPQNPNPSRQILQAR